MRRKARHGSGLAIGLLLVGAATQAPADPIPGARWQAVELLDAKDLVAGWEPGRVTVFSFFAYWCDTWKVQTPRLRSVAGIVKGLPIDVLTVSVDGRWKEMAEGGPSLRVDPGGRWSHNLGIDRVPTTVIVDARGFVRWVRSGVVRTEDVVREAKNAMAESKSSGEVFLTFDDFPPPSGGEEFLDLLRALDVRATLFCVGERVEANAKLLRRALAEGHILGCHSWRHDARSPDIARCQAAFRAAIGVGFTLARLPGSEAIRRYAGARTDSYATLAPPVVDPYGYLRPGRSEVVRRCLLAARRGAVIQLHVGVSDTDAALPEIVRSLRSRGFIFSTLR